MWLYKLNTGYYTAHQIQSDGCERADASRDGRTCLARPKYPTYFSVQVTASRIGKPYSFDAKSHIFRYIYIHIYIYICVCV